MCKGPGVGGPGVGAGQQGAQHAFWAETPRETVWRCGWRGDWNHAVLCLTPSMLLVLLGDMPSEQCFQYELTGELLGRAKLLNGLFPVRSVRTLRATCCRDSLPWNVLLGDAAM